MEPKPIYLDEDDPNFNMGLNGKLERLTTNRVAICVMSEFGIYNDTRMQIHRFNTLIGMLQAITGTFKEPRAKIKLKSEYVRQRHMTTTLDVPGTSKDSMVESIS